MSKKKKKKGFLHSRFYQIYLCIVALALIAIGVGMVWLNGYLKDVEAAEPVYVAEEVAKLFESRDFESLYALDTSAAEVSNGDKSFYVDSMHEIADGADIEWTEAFSKNENEKNYRVTVDGSKFATFTLVPSGRVTPRGNTLWALGSVSTNVELKEPEIIEPDPEIEFRVTAPADSVVTVDGRVLTGDDVLNSGIAVFPAGFLPPGIEAPTLTEYSVICNSETPEITVEDRDGNPQELTAEEDDPHKLSCGLPENTELRDRYYRAVFEVAERLAEYTSNDATKGWMHELCIRNSPAYNAVSGFDNTWAPGHRSVAFRNVSTDSYYVHSNYCITCRVSFDYVLIIRSGEEKVYRTSYTFCFAKDGNTARLYNMLLN